MKAWTIFMHSVRQLFANMTEALQISGLLYLAQLALSVVFGGPQNMTEGEFMTGGQAVGQLVSVLLFLVVMLWVAVAWHRFVLLEERPHGYLPAFNGQRVMRYGLRSVMIALVVLGVAVVSALVVGMVVFTLLGQSALSGGIVMLAAAVPLFAVLYRLSAALPGLAVDKPTGFTDGWVATSGETQTMLILALISSALGGVLGLPLGVLPPDSVVALLWEMVAGWIQMMISASILTTLYGHYIQRRPLV